jgi:hypothetical protein
MEGREGTMSPKVIILYFKWHLLRQGLQISIPILISQTVCFSGLTTQVDNPRLTTGKKTNKMNYL